MAAAGGRAYAGLRGQATGRQRSPVSGRKQRPAVTRVGDERTSGAAVGIAPQTDRSTIGSGAPY